ncbi:WD40-like Beta Propeller Repeat [Lutibacter oricola]|uniref:WD40-like Beta Propeller Repeat n=1 Tax=Lutibacter oricola TaxID=762486 RepID=A0A1H2WF04_9FLAO|nr:OmpA family protein [Lutibacter oricola]SDW79115.1 WD40-like Beta Propeller Repeat [Lutibacter oricola]
MKKNLLIILLSLLFNKVSSQDIEYKVFNTSVNTKYAELGTFYVNNDLVLFASSKITEEDTPFSKNRRKNNRHLFLEFYFGKITDKGDIIQDKKLNKEIYTKFNESDIAFSPDLKTLFFTWNNYYNDPKIDNPKNKTFYLFKASIDADFNLTSISPVRFNSVKYSIKNPKFSADGKKLYFSSNMSGGSGGYDIFVSEVSNEGVLSWPKNMGPTINTKYNELYPYSDNENNLYFSSFGHKGKGGLDIFKSNFVNNTFEKPVSLPSPINSPYDEFGYVHRPNKKEGFFTSNRDKGKGDVDIYAFKYHIKEKPCDQLITGNVFNIKNNVKLSDYQLFLYKNDTLVEGKDIVNFNNYKFNLKCNESYKIVAKKKGFISNEIKFTTNDADKFTLDKNIYLEPEKCINFVEGKILNKETKTPLPNAIVKLFKNDSLVKTLKLNKLAEYKAEINCNSTYKITAELTDFSKDNVIINTQKNNKETHNNNLYLKENIEFITVRKQKMIKTNPIYFDLDKSNIRPDASIELDKVVTIMKKYETIVIEVKSHTDSRGQDKYNFVLSNKRARSTINYIISKGIDSSRIYGKGYGETELVNHCTNGVKCHDSLHQLNRRTEFIVVKE